MRYWTAAHVRLAWNQRWFPLRKDASVASSRRHNIRNARSVLGQVEMDGAVLNPLKDSVAALSGHEI